MEDREKRDGSYSPSVAEVTGGNQTESFDVEAEIPFRALDLLDTAPVFRRDIRLPEPYLHEGGETQQEVSAGVDIAGDSVGEQLFGDSFSDSNLVQWPDVNWPDTFTDAERSEPFQSDCHETASVDSVEIVEPLDSEAREEPVQQPGAVTSRQVWSEMVANSFAEYRQTSPMLLLPWETGVLGEIFNFNQDPLPRCPG
eukprot:s1901_g8.t1